MKMKLNFCEKKARKPLVSLEKNIAEHFCSAMMSLHYKKDRVYFSLKNRRCTRKNNFLETYFDCSVSQDAYEYKKNYGGWHNTLSTGFIFLLRVDFGETSLLSYVQWFGLGSK